MRLYHHWSHDGEVWRIDASVTIGWTDHRSRWVDDGEPDLIQVHSVELYLRGEGFMWIEREHWPLDPDALPEKLRRAMSDEAIRLEDKR